MSVKSPFDSEDRGRQETEHTGPQQALRRRRLGRLGFLITGTLLTGTVAGFVLGSALPSGASSPAPVQVTVLPQVDGVDEEVTTPDVRGLSEKDARQALSDHGISAAQVVIDRIPHVASDRFVVAQDPIGGTPNPSKVTLLLPVPGVIPTLIGTPEDVARAALTAMGVQVKVARSYVPGAQPGKVISTSPRAGQPLSAAVTVTVAAQARTRLLAELADTGRCDPIESGSVNGRVVASSVACSPSRFDEASETSWLLRRKVQSITAVAGIEDHGDEGGRVRLDITGDGRSLWKKTIAYGTSPRISLDLRGVLRLTVRVQRLDEGTDDASLVLGDALLAGGSDDLAALEAR